MNIAKDLPYNIQAEHLLLGAILHNNTSLNDVQSFLLPEHFYDPLSQKVYKAIILTFEEGHTVSPISLKSKLDPDESFRRHGAENFLAMLSTSSIAVLNAQDYAEIIYDLAMRRQLIRLGESMLEKVYNSSLQNLKTREIIESTEHDLFKLATSGYIERDFQALKDIASDSVKGIFRALEMHQSNQVVGIPTGFSDLDAKLGGLQDSDLIIIAARPGMGKTAFAINLAESAAKKFLREHQKDNEKATKSVGIFSLEMSSEQLANRMISMHTNIDSLRLRSGNFWPDEHVKISGAADYLGKLPIFIDDTAGVTISTIRSRARKIYRQNNLGLIIIDYLQLIQSTGNHDNRVLEVSEITKSLKILARELNIPVIALSQLSRAVDQRTEKRPLLSDLRESGSIEQDADLVMFIFREGYYTSIAEKENGSNVQINDAKDSSSLSRSDKKDSSSSKSDRAEIIIAKHRNGPIGIVPLKYNLSSSKFSDVVMINDNIQSAKSNNEAGILKNNNGTNVLKINDNSV
jgi:replicative DNA helicase